MAQARVGTKIILGGTYEVYADDNGMFWIKELLEGGGAGGLKILGSGESLKAAVAKARTEIKKRDVKVSVPFILSDGRKATATGLDHKGNVRIEFEDGTKDSLSPGIGRQDAFDAETPPETMKRLIELKEQSEAITAERRRIEQQYKMDMGLGWRVQKEIDRAVQREAVPA